MRQREHLLPGIQSALSSAPFSSIRQYAHGSRNRELVAIRWRGSYCANGCA